MNAERIVFNTPWEAVLERFEFDETLTSEDDVVIATECSIISPGTELAILSGKDTWAKLPYYPGYGSIGRIVRKGSRVKNFNPGDRVFSYSPHQNMVHFSKVLVGVPDGLEGPKAVFCRMAAVSITALRVSEAELGDWVAVFGMGLVGNLAAQLFQLSGCNVIAIDVNNERLALAGKCGLEHTMVPDAGLKEKIGDLTKGQMCKTVVEATGNPRVVVNAPDIAAKLGEVILLGTPRGEHHCNITEFLNKCHLMKNGSITFKGAHEWRYPLKSDVHTRHSIERNLEIILKLINEKKLKVDNLLTHTVTAEECRNVYQGLRDNPRNYIGVVFDWTK